MWYIVFSVLFNEVIKQGGTQMNMHKNWGIATLIFMILTCLSAFCKPIRKSHAFWGGLTLSCLLGALASGSGLIKAKKNESAEETAETEIVKKKLKG